jgi:hypothetical protein
MERNRLTQDVLLETSDRLYRRDMGKKENK